MNGPGTAETDRSLLDSIIHIVELAQRVILNRLDLAYFDLERLAAHTLRSAALGMLGTVLLSGAWFALMAGLVVWLQQYHSLVTSLLIVAVASALLGGCATLAGVRRVRAGALETPAEVAAGARPGARRPGGTPARELGSRELGSSDE